ncbi:MAG: YihY/virulence factor BrkB family protein [Lachnospiraceae bacterium]|nr:YihY/virulence factor BrkB family protein [Lachnospiraceae bacterium]
MGFSLMILFFSLMYMTVPSRKSSFFAELPGAIITSAGWLGFSYLFSFYIDNFSNYSATYGSLTAVVLCMLWFYSCMYIMFIGAEINQVLSNPVIHEAFRNLRAIRRKQRQSRKSAKKSKDLP